MKRVKSISELEKGDWILIKYSLASRKKSFIIKINKFTTWITVRKGFELSQIKGSYFIEMGYIYK